MVFVDAKSEQDDLEELRQHRWMNLEEEIRERHREDLLQVLAYPRSPTARLRLPVWCILAHLKFGIP